MKQITTFYLDGILLGMDTRYINSILPPTAVMKLPQRKEQLFNKTMTLSDGRFIHLINSEKLLGLAPPPLNEQTKVIVMQTESPLMGLLVNETSQLLDIDDAQIAAHLPLSRINTEYFAGTVMDTEGKIVLLLNMETLVSALTAK